MYLAIQIWPLRISLLEQGASALVLTLFSLICEQTIRISYTDLFFGY